MLCASRRTVPGCVRVLRDLKEAFREPLRNVSTLAEKPAAAAACRSEVVGGGGALAGEKPSSRRTSAGGGKVAGALGLKDFMHRTRVLGLYRGILKRARAIEDEQVAIEVRRQFRLALDETEPLKIQMLVADASNQLEAMQGTVRGVAARETVRRGWI